MGSAEEFIRVWQAGGSRKEIAERLGIQIRSADSMASRLRRRGVPLKKFSGNGRRTLDYEALAALARELEK